MEEDRLHVLLSRLDDDELDVVWQHLGHDEGLDAETREEKLDALKDEFQRKFGHGIGNLWRRRFGSAYTWEDIIRRLAELLALRGHESREIPALEQSICLAHADEMDGLEKTEDSAADLSERAAKRLAKSLQRKSYWSDRKGPLAWAARRAQGPDYDEILKATLFILSCVDLHDRVAPGPEPIRANGPASSPPRVGKKGKRK